MIALRGFQGLPARAVLAVDTRTLAGRPGVVRRPTMNPRPERGGPSWVILLICGEPEPCGELHGTWQGAGPDQIPRRPPQTGY
jgi:hypothetical protein